MKRSLAFILSLIFVLSLAGCGEEKQELIVKEGDKTYLVLPESKERVLVPDYCSAYLEKIDGELVKAAEKKVCEEASEYIDEDDIFFSVSSYDDGLYLCTEHILYVDESERSDDLCGGDHVHKIFKGIIAK